MSTEPSPWAKAAWIELTDCILTDAQEDLDGMGIIDKAIDQACAQKDAEIAKLMRDVSTNDIEYTKMALESLAKDAEIARLKAQMQVNQDDADKGRAFATEAVNVQSKRIAELELMRKHAAEDWADDDTQVKALAKPFIGDMEKGNEHGDFIGVIEVTERLVKRIAGLEAMNERLSVANAKASLEISEKTADRIIAMGKLLDRVPHDNIEYRTRYGVCPEDCPACAWAKLKEGK